MKNKHRHEWRTDGQGRSKFRYCGICGTRAMPKAAWWGIAIGTAVVAAIAVAAAVGGNTDRQDMQAETRDRPTTTTTLLSRSQAGAMAREALARADIGCGALESEANCLRRAINVVCENRFGDTGWATSEEYDCRREVIAAMRRLGL